MECLLVCPRGAISEAIMSAGLSPRRHLSRLANPEIQLHTDRILALQKDEQQGREALGRITAAIGAELIAVKEALDKTQNKTAWLRWLKNHVHYSAVTAWRYMEVARFIKKSFNGERFFDLDLAVL